MPRIHTAVFKVRHYECDPFGHVNHANYLRYMQEAAFGASADVGYTPQRYAALDLSWLAYETDITYLQPLHYGDTLTIQTWVQDFRRVRSLRHYALYRDDDLIAQASTDWVLIDTAKKMPVTIPPEIVSAYSDGEAPLTIQHEPPLPEVPPPADGVFTLRRRVEWRDIDPVGHVNNAVYLNYAADCGMQFGRAIGWSFPRLRELGYGRVARRHFVEYKASAVCDDEIEISTWLSHMRRASAIRHYAMRRVSDNKLIARVRTLGAWVDLKTGRPTRIPQGFIEAVAFNMVEAEDERTS